jgi:hypothetical protein
MDTPTDLAYKNSRKHYYVKAVCTRIDEKEAKLNYVKNKIERGVKSGRVVVSEQLRNAQRQADAHVVVARQRLEELTGADDGKWEELRRGLDVACDDLSESLKKLVARVY